MDEYLKLLLEQIRCTKARPYIKQELQDHMEDQIAENMKAGMDHEQAEKEAVRDMGDPVETGISLDSIHRPQAAWKLLGIIIFISIAGVLIHAGISGKASENAAAGSDRYVFHVMIGLAVMMILYLLDYTVLAKFSKIIAAVLLAVCLLVILEGGQVNGARIFISLPGGRRGMDVQKLMLFYVPIYGAILYKYHGWGYKGLIRAILWLIAPVILVYSLPALRTACVMLVTMLTMLTIAIKKDWFTVRKKRTICGIWAVFLTAPIAAFLGMYLRNRLAEYQIARIQAMFSSGSETDYLTKMLHSLWRQNKLIGKSKSDVTVFEAHFCQDPADFFAGNDNIIRPFDGNFDIQFLYCLRHAQPHDKCQHGGILWLKLRSQKDRHHNRTSFRGCPASSEAALAC